MSANETSTQGQTEYSRGWWLAKIKAAEKAHKDWSEDAKEAYKAYWPPDANKQEYYPLFWANTQIIHSALYARTPKPDVRKRWKDAQVPKQIPQAIERALSYLMDTEDFDGHMHRAVDDYLIAGVGFCKIEYDVETVDEPVLNPMTGQPIMVEQEEPGENEAPEPVDQNGAELASEPESETSENDPEDEQTQGVPLTTKRIGRQSLRLRYIPWNRFIWEPSPDWDHVDWIAFKHYLSKAEVKERWPEAEIKEGDTQSSGGGQLNVKPEQPNEAKYEGLVCVYEIWCKRTRKLHWIGEAVKEIDQTIPDPLRLRGFYPGAPPMLLNLKDGTILPKTDYSYIGQQCVSVDDLSQRVIMLQKQVKDVGVYDASFPELQQIARPTVVDGTYVGIENLLARLGAIPGQRPSMDTILVRPDNANKVQTLQTLLQLREQAIQAIFQITGISDIVRGASDPNETASAQQIKSRWSNVRLIRKQSTVNEHIRQTLRIMAELVAEHFEPEQIALMTGTQLTPQDIDILKSDIGRTFAIDIETDSTVIVDEAEDKQQRLELTKTFMDYAQGILPAVQSGAMPASLGKEVMSLAIGGFKYANGLEEALDALPDTAQQLQELNQKLQQAQQQIEQMGKQLQDAQKQLAQVDAQANARENAETQAGVAKTGAETQRTIAETQRIAAETQGSIVRTQREAVTPIRDPNMPRPMQPR